MQPLAWLASLVDTITLIGKLRNAGLDVRGAIIHIGQHSPVWLPLMWQMAQPCLQVIAFSVLGITLTVGFAAMYYGMVVILMGGSKSHSA